MKKLEETNEEFALTTIADSGFLAARSDIEQVKAVLASNLGAQGIRAEDLPRHGVPAGGATSWTLDLGEGEESAKELDGIILSHTDGRVYWSGTYGEGDSGNSPDCYSNDLLTGVGNPGGSCLTCEFAQFGSALKPSGEPARGQACQQRKVLLVLPPYSVLPLSIALSPGSLKSIRKYLVSLGGRMLRYDQVVTRFAWRQEKSGDGQKYAVIDPRVVRTPSEKEQALISVYRDLIQKTTDAPIEDE